jgi:hypothetical protein
LEAENDGHLTRFHLGSNDKGLDGNMRSMDMTIGQIIAELQKAVVVKS